METLSDDEVAKQYEIFLKTFSEEEKHKAIQIIDYISRQLNDKTLRGYIEHEFDYAVIHAAIGLWNLCFLEQIKFPESFFVEERNKMLEELQIGIDELNKNQELIDELYRRYYERLKKENYSFEDELTHAKTIWKSSFNLMYLLFTRVHKGRDYHLILAEIESRKPVMVAQK
jgi:hypothetical protein